MSDRELIKFGLKRLGFKNLGDKNIKKFESPKDVFRYDVWAPSNDVWERKIHTISPITDKISISSWDCASDAKNLENLRYTSVLNVCTKIRSEEYIEKLSNLSKISYLHIPFEESLGSSEDNDQNDIYNRLEKCYDYIRKSLRKNGRILIHCESGVNRSVMVASYFWMKRVYADILLALEINTWLSQIFLQIQIIRPIIMINPIFIKK